MSTATMLVETMVLEQKIYKISGHNRQLKHQIIFR